MVPWALTRDEKSVRPKDRDGWEPDPNIPDVRVARHEKIAFAYSTFGAQHWPFYFTKSKMYLYRPLSLISAVASLPFICHGAPLLDLSNDYLIVTPRPEIGVELEEIGADEPNINAFVALECGRVVGEYYDEEKGHNENSIFHLWSMTKTWSGLLYGVAAKEGLLKVNETLGEIWKDPETWPEGSEARQNITVEHILQMRSGLRMPE